MKIFAYIVLGFIGFIALIFGVVYFASSGARDHARGFVEDVSAGDFAADPPFPTFADGHHEILLCEAILKSHLEQRWVEIENGELR